MASLKFLIIASLLAVGASAKFVWQDDEFPNFPKPRMPTPPTPPSFPSFNFPAAPFPPFPPSALFPPGFGQFNFPNIPLPVVPNPGQIRDVKPGPGQMFQGMAVSSGSQVVKDKNGKWVQKGGISVISNDNGKVHEFKQGNAPPNMDVPLTAPRLPNLEFPKFPSFLEMEPLEFPKFPEFKPLEFPEFPKMKPIKFPEFEMPEIKPIDVEKMKSYQPKKGETYHGTASSSFSNSRTVNGKTASVGGSSVLVNDNGKADEEHVLFHKADGLGV